MKRVFFMLKEAVIILSLARVIVGLAECTAVLANRQPGPVILSRLTGTN